MAINLSISGNFLTFTDTVSGEVKKYPQRKIRYSIYNSTVHFIYMDRHENDLRYTLSDLQDQDGNAWTNQAALENWLDRKTGSVGTVETLTQDNDSEDLSVYLARFIDTFTVLTGVAINGEEIDIETTGTTPTTNDFLCIREDTSFYQAQISTVTPISGNQYTIGVAIPFDYAYTVAAGCEVVNPDMNVDGSVTPVVFSLVAKNLDLFAWDITRMVVSMTHSSAGDDGLFGGITALTNGVYFRTIDGTTHNLFNAKENADFASEAAGDLTYTTRSGGGGTYGTRGRITFNGPDKRGVVKRLKFTSSDEFRGVVRDNLSTLTRFRIKLQGQVAID